MHVRVYREFDKICLERHHGDAVLEVGAVPADDTLLTLPALKNAARKVGINPEGPAVWRGCEILRGSANRMDVFHDGVFDTVLANSVLEHDRFFWLSLAEMKRVLRPGGLLVIGVPGFARLAADRIFSALGRMIPRRGSAKDWANSLPAATLTLKAHDFPDDYYRFSPSAVRDVFIYGLENPGLVRIMIPPRIIGWGNTIAD